MHVRRRTLLALVAVAVAASAVAYASLAAGQSIETETTCGGKIALDRSQPAEEHGVTFKLRCSAPVTAFTLVSTKTVDGFTPEIDSFAKDGKPGDFKCVGEIPADGFRCFGKKLDAGLIAGGFNTDQAPCDRKDGRLRVWAVATGPKGDNSRPRRLTGLKCPKAKKPKAKRKRG